MEVWLETTLEEAQRRTHLPQAYFAEVQGGVLLRAGVQDKEQIPVRWLLSHQAGLPIVDGPLTFEQACAWHPVIRALEAQKPEWEPGTEHDYHSVTFGFLVGELVRRITGRSLGTFFADEVAAPLGLSAWIGLSEEQEGRVARIEYAAPFSLEEMIAGMREESLFCRISSSETFHRR